MRTTGRLFQENEDELRDDQAGDGAVFTISNDPRPQKSRRCAADFPETREEQGNPHRVFHEPISIAVKQFLLFRPHHGIVEGNKKQAKRRQQPVTLAGYDNAKRHNE